MANDPGFLKTIFDSDKFNLLDKAEVRDKVKKTEDFNLADAKEKELNEWIEENGREPSKDSGDITESMLGMRLEAVKRRKHPDAEVQKKIDDDPFSSSLLDKMIKEADMGLTDFSNSILTPPSLKKKKKDERASTDFSSKRTAMADFSAFEPIFARAQAELDKGIRKAQPFTAKGFCQGRFYIEGGILCFIDQVYEPQANKFGRTDRRIHVVYANHTESYVLFATFQKTMSLTNGRLLTEPDTDTLGNKLDPLRQEDVETGYIYILRSCSTEEAIKPYGKDFYKVGYTHYIGEKSVEKRISNAVNEPTYLCAPVVIVEKWRCSNLNAQALETFLHRFLKEGQVRIMVNDKGKHQIASEWFNVPLEVLEEMVPMILDGTIVKFRYNSYLKKLVRE